MRSTGALQLVDEEPHALPGRLIRVVDRGARSDEASRELGAEVEQEWKDHHGAERMGQLHATLGDPRENTDLWR